MEWSDAPEQPFGTRIIRLAIDEELNVKYSYKVAWWALPWFVAKFVYAGIVEGITITVVTATQPIDGKRSEMPPAAEQLKRAGYMKRCH